MHEAKFTTWLPWGDRNLHENAASPGVYAIAVSERPLTGRRFTWREEIIYVGMTNAVAGLRGRLRQFDMTMAGRLAHGGADRVRFKHRSYNAFRKRAYVAVAPFKRDPASNLSRDLRTMGEVAKFEFLCLACFVDKFGRLPKFNDKKKAPKFSKTETSHRAT
jgi:hypothetical protein